MKIYRLALIGALLAGCQVNVTNPNVTANTVVDANANVTAGDVAVNTAASPQTPASVEPAPASPAPSKGPVRLIQLPDLSMEVPESWQVTTPDPKVNAGFTDRFEALLKDGDRPMASIIVTNAAFDTTVDAEWLKYQTPDTSAKGYKQLASTKVFVSGAPGFHVKHQYDSPNGGVGFTSFYGAMSNGRFYLIVLNHHGSYAAADNQFADALASLKWLGPATGLPTVAPAATPTPFVPWQPTPVPQVSQPPIRLQGDSQSVGLKGPFNLKTGVRKFSFWWSGPGYIGVVLKKANGDYVELLVNDSVSGLDQNAYRGHGKEVTYLVKEEGDYFFDVNVTRELRWTLDIDPVPAATQPEGGTQQ